MINYNDPSIWFGSTTHKMLLMTDGTVTVSGTNYTVTGGTVTIDNSILEAESFELKQSLNSGTQIQFGSCEAAEINFVIHENIPTIKGKTLKVYIIPDHDASKMLQIGVFKVAEDKLSADRTKRSITAFDALYDIINADVAAWYNSELPNSSSTKTLAQFRADFLNHFSITAESTTLTNDSITIKRTIAPETLSGADVIRAICEINGCFGTITNEGKFRYVELANTFDVGLFPSDTLYPANDLYPQSEGASDIPKSKYIDVQFEDYESEGITQLVVRTDDKDVGATVGTAGNTYIITGNFLVYGFNAVNLTSVATNILNKIKNRPYTPASVTALGNPLHEVGDAISIHSTYRTIKTYIFERRLSGIQALRDTYTAQGEQYSVERLNTVSSMFQQLSNKTTQIEVDVDHFQVTVQEDYVSKDGVVTDLNTKMSGITITPSSIAISSTGTFSVDSSNFRLAANGALTIRNVTFDYSGSGYTDMTISNGILTAGDTTLTGFDYTELKNNGLKVGIVGNNSTYTDIGASSVSIHTSSADVSMSNSGLVMSSNCDIQIGAMTLSCGNSNQLLVNGYPVMMSGGSSISVDTLYADSMIQVGDYYSSSTFIFSSSIQTDTITVGTIEIGTHSSNGFHQVRDINNNLIYVLAFS